MENKSALIEKMESFCLWRPRPPPLGCQMFCNPFFFFFFSHSIFFLISFVLTPGSQVGEEPFFPFLFAFPQCQVFFNIIPQPPATSPSPPHESLKTPRAPAEELRPPQGAKPRASFARVRGRVGAGETDVTGVAWGREQGRAEGLLERRWKRIGR